MEKRIWRIGMIGGGPGAFIGPVHRRAALLDGRARLVCGAFSRSPDKAKAAGCEWGLDPARVHCGFKDLLADERRRPADERMDIAVVAAPNDIHYPAARAALAAGFHVVCDKPLAATLAQARRLSRQAQEAGRLLCVTYTYSGYAMIREAQALARGGRLGAIRRVVAQYPQAGLTRPPVLGRPAKEAWRGDPRRAGPTRCMGDIGIHAAHLIETVTGLAIQSVCADLATFTAGQTLDDDGSVLLRLERGARGVLWASQVAVGEENALAIQIYGEQGSLAWRQLDPDSLTVRWRDRPMEIRRRGSPGLSPEAAGAARLPAGHPEGFHDALANLYRAFYDALEAPPGSRGGYPNADDGVRGLAFLDAVLRSARSNRKWTAVSPWGSRPLNPNPRGAPCVP